MTVVKATTTREILRWIFDALLVIGITVGGWLFGRVDRLENEYAQTSSRIESINESLIEFNESVHKLTDSVDKLSSQQQALVILTTFRTDPWSGSMMKELQDEWFDTLLQLHPDSGLKYSDMPDVKKIQKELAEELLPEGMKKELDK